LRVKSDPSRVQVTPVGSEIGFFASRDIK
jgi:hypothetical protein